MEVALEEKLANGEEAQRNNEHKKVDENTIRKRNLEGLQTCIDKHIERRGYRFQYAEAKQENRTQWNLIAAALEEVNIEFHNLQGREATKMRGRSKVTCKRKPKA